jgi:hypothetical protein
MIANHEQFIEAIQERRKVSVRFYSKMGRGVIDLVCAPLDYGPGAASDRVSRYWLWDQIKDNGAHTLSLLPEQVLDMRILGEVFDPAKIDARPPHWSIARDWGTQSRRADAADGPLAPVLLPLAPEPSAGGCEGLRTLPAKTD